MTARNTARTPSAADHKPAPRPEAEKATKAEQQAAGADLARRMGQGAPRTTKVAKKNEIRHCACGCGATTKRTFAPGHDTRVGPRADGRKAGEKAATAALTSGQIAADLPADEASRALWLAGFGAAIREAGSAWAS